MICTLGPLTTELCGLQYQRIGFRGRSHVFRSTVAVFTHSATSELGGWEPDEDRSNAGRKCQEMFELRRVPLEKLTPAKPPGWRRFYVTTVLEAGMLAFRSLPLAK